MGGHFKPRLQPARTARHRALFRLILTYRHYIPGFHAVLVPGLEDFQNAVPPRGRSHASPTKG